MEAFFDREVKKLEFVTERAELRARGKRDKDSANQNAVKEEVCFVGNHDNHGQTNVPCSEHPISLQSKDALVSSEANAKKVIPSPNSPCPHICVHFYNTLPCCL